MSIEEDIKKMEEITNKLKVGETPLEESLKLFEEGITIAKRVEKNLSEMERKVEILTSEETLIAFEE